MNRHYLREQDFGRRGDAAETESRLTTLRVDDPPNDEPEPSIDIHPMLKAIVILIGVPIGLGLCVLCYYLLYLFITFVYGLSVSLFS